MDHQYNHQWPQGPAQVNMCPVCYIPHFPFCPPPHPQQAPSFPPPPPDYPRPGFSPYQPPPPPLPPMVPYHRPYVGNASDGFGDPRSWHGNQNSPFGNVYPVDGEADRSYKRPRVDDERRLNLIREHGGAASLGGFNDETSRYTQNNGPSTRMNEFSSDEKNKQGSSNNQYHNRLQQHQQQHYGRQHPTYPQQDGYQGPAVYHLPRPFGNNVVQSPLPVSPPPTVPLEPPGLDSSDLKPRSSPGQASSSLIPVPFSSSLSGQVTSEAHSFNHSYYQNKPPMQHPSAAFVTKDALTINRTPPEQYGMEGHSFPSKQFSSDKPRVIDATQLFKQPHRAARPDHVVLILRGLPGSGKSYLAKILRDLEVENECDAPRIHAMDDYFMTEVEKADETDASKASNSVRSKKPMIKKVMEYCYEPEMEEAYRESMLKAFRRTVEEGVFSFVIVDDRNLLVADFAQFWAIGKRSGYEVYILEPTYKDPVGCAARNVHGFTLEDIQEMAGRWEDAPSLYWRLDVKSLFHGDDLKESGIQEVDMDMGDENRDEESTPQLEIKTKKLNVPSIGGEALKGYSKYGKRWVDGGEQTTDVKELSRSKWSNDTDEDDIKGSKDPKRNFSALSGLIQAYSKEGKSVHWGDQVRDSGFSIVAAKLAKAFSLVIGPGAGYNLKSNPLPKEENLCSNNLVSSEKHTVVFQEQIRAEQESFKAFFDRRKQRIGLDVDED